MAFFKAEEDNSKTYAFIDMSNFISGWQEWSKAWFGSDVSLNWEKVMARIRSGKYFVYDAIEEAPRDGEEESDYNRRAREQRERLKKVEAVDFVHVETGRLVPGKKGVKQKGVDVRLAIDCLEHAHRGNCTKVVLFSGDSDFTPLVRALVRNGIMVKVIAWRRRYAEDLILASDVSEIWDLDQAMGFSESGPGVRRVISAVRDSYVVGRNTGMNKEFSVEMKGGSYVFYTGPQENCLLIGRDPFTGRELGVVGTKEEITDYWKIQHEEDIPWPETP